MQNSPTGFLSIDSSQIADVNRARQEAADPENSAWVSANAGSGKTSLLVERMLRLLMQISKPSEILALTFTKAAAAEMRERLYARLSEWALMPDEQLEQALMGLSTDPPNLQKARSLFAYCLEPGGGPAIQTLHSFCEEILSRFPLEAGLLPGFRLLDENESNAEIEKLAMQWFETGFERFHKNPDDPEAQAWHFAAQSFSQQTYLDLCRKILQNYYALLPLAHQGWQANQAAVCAEFAIPTDRPISQQQDETLIFSPQEREEIRHLATDIERIGGNKIEIICQQLGRLTDAGAQPEEKLAALTALTMTGNGTRKKRLPGQKPHKELALYKKLLGEEKTDHHGLLFARLENFRQVEYVLAQQHFSIIAEKILKLWQKFSTAQGVLRFDDIIQYAYALLRKNEYAQWVAYRLDGQISHLLLDEAQDCSPIQWEVVHALNEEFFSGQNSEKNQRSLFIVGDEKQSIYRFQGAEPKRFALEKEKLRQHSMPDNNQDAQNFSIRFPRLLLSFRSSPEILQFVDQLLSKMEPQDQYLFLPKAEQPISKTVAPEIKRIEQPQPAQPMGSAPSRMDMPVNHHAFRAGQSGAVELWPCIEVPEKNKELPWEAPIDQPAPNDPGLQLANRIALQIKHWIEQGEKIWCKGRESLLRPMQYGDVMILLRSRKALYYQIVSALTRHGVAVAGADRIRLRDELAVQDILSLMRAASQPMDDLSVAEVMKGSFGGLTNDEKWLSPLCQNRKGTTLFQQLQNSSEPLYRDIQELLSEAEQHASGGPYDFLIWLLHRIDRNEESGWQKLTRRCGLDSKLAIDRLSERAIIFEANYGADLDRFSTHLLADDQGIRRELDQASGKVRVMTIHGSKGLEAPVVILPETTKNSPSRRSGSLSIHTKLPEASFVTSNLTLPAKIERAKDDETSEDRGENLRLFYVAMTRARDRLIICGKKHGAFKSAKDQADGGKIDPDSWYALAENTLKSLPATPFHLIDGAQAMRFCGDIAVRGKEISSGSTKLHPSSQTEPPPEWVSKQWSGASKELDRPQTKPISFADERARQLGIDLHKGLELLPYRATAEIIQRYVKGLAETEYRDQTAKEELHTQLLGSLHHPDLERFFSENSFAEIRLMGMTKKLEKTAEFAIDRLCIEEEEVHILDYKSSAEPMDDDRILIEQRIQLRRYAELIQQLYPEKNAGPGYFLHITKSLSKSTLSIEKLILLSR